MDLSKVIENPFAEIFQLEKIEQTFIVVKAGSLWDAKCGIKGNSY